MTIAADARMYWRFARGLHSFLRNPISLEDARAIVRRRLQERESALLGMVRRAVEDAPTSPYRALLEIAGCELGDIEDMVRKQSVEGTLSALAEAGVYVTFEEFKGRRPIERGGKVIPVSDSDFVNPHVNPAYETWTGGSTGPARRVSTDLDHLAAQAPHVMLTRHAHGVLDAPMGLWRGTLPDPTGVGTILRAARGGRVPQKWFAQLTDSDVRPPLRHRLATAFIIHLGRAYGVPIPSPEAVPMAQAATVARWAAAAAAEHGSCLLGTTVSLSLRVCVAAQSEDLSMEGVVFTGGGEPPTPGKVRAITSTGARWLPGYYSVETGSIGLGCARPLDGNDLHLMSDSLALIQRPRTVPGSDLEVPAFCFTTLLPSTPKLLLNVETDDYGILERRACGCPLEEYGFTHHLREVRSFGKLTGEGITLVGSDLVRILEEVLPERFGGGPLDYQLLEEEDDSSYSRIVLVVSPRVKIEDEGEVVETVLRAIAETGLAGRLAQATWRQAQSLRVRRADPVWTGRGKLLPLHLSRRATSLAAQVESPKAEPSPSDRGERQ